MRTFIEGINPVTCLRRPTLGLLSLLTILTSLRCGVVHLGQSTPNDPVPVGTPVIQGTFTASAVSGKTVTGNAIIYSDGTTNTLRLVGFTCPVENGLLMNVTVGSDNVALTLHAYTGTQNYGLTLSGAPVAGTSGEVTIHSQVYNLDYGQALLR